MSDFTLYAFPFACSFAVHLKLARDGLSYQLRWVQRGPARQIQGEEFAALNPKRKVPTLILPDGERLTEIIGVLLYLDELRSPARPAAERRRLLEWLSFLATELHKPVLAPAFDPALAEADLSDVRDRLLPPALAHLESTLSGRETLLGGAEPSGADAFAFWALLLLRQRWPDAVATPGLEAFRRRILASPVTREVIAREQQAMARSA